MMEKHEKSYFKLMMIVVAFAIIVLSIFSNNIVYSQQASPKEARSMTALSSSSSSSPPNLHAVRIISPIKGQQVAVGKDLTIIGSSLDNATTNCQVSIIMNSIKPYQPATGTGHGGATDYSTWNFVFTSNYASLKPGPNIK